MEKNILVVDDEASIVTLLEYNLNQSGFNVLKAYDGQEALKQAVNEQLDLIILDLMLPKMDGIEVCKEIRKRQIDTPILMLTAKDDEFDKVLGLELGADDYMTKPFSPREVVARVKAILRRTKNLQDSSIPNERGDGKIQLGELTIFPEHYEVYLNGNQLEFTPKEFELLIYLVKNKGRVLTRDQLLNAVWNYDFVGDTRIVDVHISHLREKIEKDTRKPKYIKTIRGIGYKFEEPKG
ncbi:response regulator transcription factor [Fervidibacillus albus]|uniref:Response regulator transcription factor n=1 Tax=Fervidibacillus albus TaxID=2980026 RepID=A0A9E8RWK6_9BACI|nr:response regulator transcription factor [Fervidibacillus albus]WAA10173.1 response regulator transcription factor [Fervidibacillus albus]